MQFIYFIIFSNANIFLYKFKMKAISTFEKGLNID